MLFTLRFFILITLGTLPVLLAWSPVWGKWYLLGWNLICLLLAFIDYYRTEGAEQFKIARKLPKRFIIGEENEVRIELTSSLKRQIKLQIKDEYPSELDLRGERLLTAIIPSRARRSTGRAVRLGDYPADRPRSQPCR